jgi:hypothetical protein
MVPKFGFSDQVTPLLLVPPTLAVNVWLCEGSKETEGGVSKTDPVAFTVRLSCAEFEPPALVAVTVNVKTPAAVGVPPRTPAEEPRVSPAGSVEPLAMVKVMGVVPVAVRVCE